MYLSGIELLAGHFGHLRYIMETLLSPILLFARPFLIGNGSHFDQLSGDISLQAKALLI